MKIYTCECGNEEEGYHDELSTCILCETPGRWILSGEECSECGGDGVNKGYCVNKGYPCPLCGGSGVGGY